MIAREPTKFPLGPALRQSTAALPAHNALSTSCSSILQLARRRRAKVNAHTLTSAWHAWHGLAKRGRDPLAVGPTGIVAIAARYVRTGSRLGIEGKRTNLDLLDSDAQRKLGITLVRIDPAGRSGVQPELEVWRKWLVLNRRGSPAEAVYFTIDFPAWLNRLPQKAIAGYPILDLVAQRKTPLS